MIESNCLEYKIEQAGYDPSYLEIYTRFTTTYKDIFENPYVIKQHNESGHGGTFITNDNLVIADVGVIELMVKNDIVGQTYELEKIYGRLSELVLGAACGGQNVEREWFDRLKILRNTIEEKIWQLSNDEYYPLAPQLSQGIPSSIVIQE